jgi:hypothetical protein
MEKKMVTITKKDCRRCRFVLVCTGAALFGRSLHSKA